MTLDSAIITLARSIRIEEEIARQGIRLRDKVERAGACPVCGGRDRFSVNARKQLWNCRGCNKGGSVIDLVMHLGGCSFADAVHTLAGTDPSRPAPRIDQAKLAEAQAKGKRAEIEELISESENLYKAIKIWSDAKPIEGTPAEVYLRDHRKLDIPDGVSGRVLRFHPASPFGSTTYPCMIAAVRSIQADELGNANNFQAIYRTAVNPDGTPIKIDGKTARKALGPTKNGAVKITDNAEVTTCLGIGEGIESALSMRRMPEFGMSPVWALISDKGVRDFPIFAGIECLWIAVDNDNPDQRGRQAGNETALVCSRRWTAAGREVYRIVPDQVGCDLNDVVRSRCW